MKENLKAGCEKVRRGGGGGGEAGIIDFSGRENGIDNDNAMK